MIDKNLRDAFALAAMQGILSYDGFTQAQKDIARQAYAMADAMLEESERICPMCHATKNSLGKLHHYSGCEFGWPSALPSGTGEQST